ncbi:hypothetical protein E4T49_03458 [Aureobasidium sp. EXF-10728]|nr:hypothetical protein E4T49_03458 [Aureobasidium sp. EXF-10728]
MVKLTTVTSANTAFIKQQHLTAVFVGATNGIGEFTVRELCKTHGNSGSGLRIILVGRNENAARTIINACKLLCATAEFHFVQAGDISLLAHVDKACEEIKTILTATKTQSIDILIMTQGKVEFGGRIDTNEGLDKSMSLLYYSRIRFTTTLLPFLTSSTLPTGAKIISVYAAGMESQGRLYPSDLSLSSPNHYSFANNRTHVTVMKTMFFEHLAAKHTNLSFSHIFPGLVVHKGFNDPNFPWWFKVAWGAAKPVVRFLPMYVSADEIGQRVLYLCTDGFPARGSSVKTAETAIATDGVKGGGAYSLAYTNETNDISKFYQKLRMEKIRERVVEHTEAVFQAVEEKGVFLPVGTA